CLRYLEPGQSVPVLSPVLYFSRVENTGAAFGILKNYPALPAIISVLFLSLFFYRAMSRKTGAARSVVALGGSVLSERGWTLIAAGAAGNLLDRLFLGRVVDFIDFRVWPVFNVADSLICVGAALLCLDCWLHRGCARDRH
ncbi:MAG: signal peptidase II, partial [Candidatus Omnitrophota bacterium]